MAEERDGYLLHGFPPGSSTEGSLGGSRLGGSSSLDNQKISTLNLLHNPVENAKDYSLDERIVL
jgi:hypothetical protein